ncbi:MAG: hypothetical protein HXX20_15370 [Chloroflexi bacterium]|nr:hypothetical protein [Chloroflexota bacterium]
MNDLRKPLWDSQKSRQLVKRIVVEGRLILQTPAHFGSGDEQGSLLPLVLDEVTGQPLLTGASLAGALRSYLWTLEQGYGKKQAAGGMTAKLFGGVRESDKGAQSSLIVDDAYGKNVQTELRDGVKISAASRTAEEDKLYTFMVWSAGVSFDLRFELLISQGKAEEEAELRQALANALNGLQNGQITLGARKHRGFGRVTIAEWRVREFDLQKPNDLIAWVREGGITPVPAGNISKDIFTLLKTTDIEDKRERFTMTANFALEDSVLIRADSTVADMAHLHSNGKPVVSGTSLAGVIRARAMKIAQTLKISQSKEQSKEWLDEMFGAYGENKDKNRTASRVTIEEREIEQGEIEKWVQSRVAIDRFTGGALDTALFNQQPHFGGMVQVNLELRQPKPREIALLLLVLKDLWTGDLPIGGESSVGRGRLRGQSAKLQFDGQEWVLSADKKGLKIEGDAASLEKYVKELSKEVSPV